MHYIPWKVQFSKDGDSFYSVFFPYLETLAVRYGRKITIKLDRTNILQALWLKYKLPSVHQKSSTFLLIQISAQNCSCYLCKCVYTRWCYHDMECSMESSRCDKATNSCVCYPGFIPKHKGRGCFIGKTDAFYTVIDIPCTMQYLILQLIVLYVFIACLDYHV